MQIRIKKNVLLTLLLINGLCSFATHIIGGDITVKHLNGNNFEVTLRFYRDCSSLTLFDNQISLGVYDKLTNASAFEFNMSLFSQQVLPLGDGCYTPTNLCVEEGIYKTTTSFPNNPNGYYVSWQRCCRNGIIQNITLPGDAGMVFYAEIPNPALGNSSPVFGSYPNGYMCISQPNTQNFSAIDQDGDSLVYSLITPLNGNASSINPSPFPSQGPYSNITWQSPYNAANMIGGSPVMTIDAQTGVLTASPSALGVYVFAVRVKEYRNGAKIGEIRRDIQYQVLGCNTNAPPVFNLPSTHSYTVTAGDSICIPIQAHDPNSDWVGLSATSELFQNSPTKPEIRFVPDSAIATVQSQLCVTSTCAHIRETPYHITLNVRDYSCYGTNTVPYEIDIYVKSPLEGTIDSLVPNVFTPNNDGANDSFKINAENINDCFDFFKIKIYGRWGELVFESSDFHFKWDGLGKNDRKMENGVYYYIIDGSFKDVPFNYNGFIQLFR